MSRRKAIQELSTVVDVMRGYDDLVSPLPEAGAFYLTFNDSIVFVYAAARNEDIQTVILRGGVGTDVPGDTYILDEDGNCNLGTPGPRVVLGLRKKLDLQLPI